MTASNTTPASALSGVHAATLQVITRVRPLSDDVDRGQLRRVSASPDDTLSAAGCMPVECTGVCPGCAACLLNAQGSALGVVGAHHRQQHQQGRSAGRVGGHPR